MGYEVKVIADSLAPNGARITTFQLRYPMKVHWDFMTHRAFSRNASSGRAISVARMVRWVAKDPVKPLVWIKDGAQMKSGGRLPDDRVAEAEAIWSRAFEDACRHAIALAGVGVHRQESNSLLMPFGWINVCVTATSFDNYFALRCDPAQCDPPARPEMQKLAVMMARAIRDSVPTPIELGQWHLPYITEGEINALCLGLRTGPFHSDVEDYILKLCVARCARVSYKAHDGSEPDPARDVELHDRLLAAGHWSAFEHAAKPIPYGYNSRSGNFRGWTQYRQTLPMSVHKQFDFAKLNEYGDRDFIV